MRGDVTVAMKLKDGDEVIAAEIVQKDADLLFVTEKGMCLRCVNTVSEQVKAAGGVRDFTTACAMIEAGANRIGTSSAEKILD